MRSALSFAAAALLAALLVPSGIRAEPMTIERAVARVDGHPILLSEIRRRARPYLRRIDGAAARAVATRGVYRSVLERRIDEQLARDAAETRGVTVADWEVDAALDRMAKDQSLDIQSLLAEGFAAGYSRTAYLEEVRRQLLLQKLLRLDIADKKLSAPTDTAAAAGWWESQQKRYLHELRKNACIEQLVRW